MADEGLEVTLSLTHAFHLHLVPSPLVGEGFLQVCQPRTRMGGTPIRSRTLIFGDALSHKGKEGTSTQISLAARVSVP